MFRRTRARNEQAERDERRAYEDLMWAARLVPPLPDPQAVPEPAASAPAGEEDFLPWDLRLPTREDLAGLMMRYDEPLVVAGEVRTCPQCAAYRTWVVCIMRENVWLRCPQGHETYEPQLDAAWYNRNSGPLTSLHNTLGDGLKALGH
ncbi:hypothetical protein [Streptomyces sp. H27-D2]|uniref:hypothetical protein n=1 Tax=Streptomyces sp. H27-D2 TaxID=3046304 RepID=UPI002DB6BB08|nr:hypothetical protein [Streptomyces sp. H27-D2]MEC4019693.1 hypothetical protein [Streptomyces sp. H27-D2]